MQVKKIDDAGSVIKELYFNLLNKSVEMQRERISHIVKNYKFIYGIEPNIPIASVVVNNKVIELMNEFKEAGISIFSEKIDNYNVVSTSFVGGAIMDDLIGKLETSTSSLRNIDNLVVQTMKQKSKRATELQTMTFVKRLCAKAFHFWGIDSGYGEGIKLSDENRESIDSAIQQYSDFIDEIWSYNLKENIIPAIAKEIVDKEYPESNIHEIITENIVPVLEKLSLENLVPQIAAEIVNYKKSKGFKHKKYEFSINEEFGVPQFSAEYVNGNIGHLTEEQKMLVQRKSKELAKRYSSINNNSNESKYDEKRGNNREI